MSEEPPVSSFPPMPFDLGEVFGRIRTEELVMAGAGFLTTQLHVQARLPTTQELVMDLAQRDGRNVTLRGYTAIAELHHALSDALAAYTGS